MATNIPVQMIDKQQWLEPIADRLQPAIARALDDGGAVGPCAANFLHGTWLGHPLHAVLTDVPVGAWSAAAIFDTVEATTGNRSMGRAADCAIGVGLVGALLAAATGLADWSKIGKGRRRKVGLVHGLLNTTAAALYLGSLALRGSGARESGRRAAVWGFAIAGVSAYLGGHLVYREKVGVDHTAGFRPPREFIPVLPESELADDQLRRVDVDGMPILLVRRGERIYALAETCAHLGGPLAQGRVEDLSVRCPWHGSCYSLEDGRVLRGPSAHPQPVLAVRVRDGRIEVRGLESEP